MEIICAGYPKTGTKSCTAALRTLGYNVADYPETRRRRTRTAKIRTALSCPCPAGQTDSGQSFFREIRTKPGQRTESRQKESGQTDTGKLFF